MFAAVALVTVMVTVTFWIHYRSLRLISAVVPRLKLALQARVLFVIWFAFLAHVVEVGLYAIAYFVAVEYLQLGYFGGLGVEGALDYLYFSFVSYTSLGLGDVFPGGHLRFLTGVEALNGLLLIAWTASFAYLAMGQLWPWQRCD